MNTSVVSIKWANVVAELCEKALSYKEIDFISDFTCKPHICNLIYNLSTSLRNGLVKKQQQHFYEIFLFNIFKRRNKKK